METRTKEQLDAIILEGTAEELNHDAFWQEYAKACGGKKNGQSVAVEPAVDHQRGNSRPGVRFGRHVTYGGH